MVPLGFGGMELAQLAVAVLGGVSAVMLVVAVARLFSDPQRWVALALGAVTIALTLAGVAVLLGAGQLIFDRENWTVGDPVSITSRGLDAQATVSLSGGGSDREAWVARTFGERIKDNTLGTDLRVTERRPTTAQWAGAIAAVFGRFAAIVVVLWSLRALLARSLAGRVFDEANARALRLMAGALFVAGPVTAWLQDAVVRSLFALPEDFTQIEGTASLTPVFIAVLLLALAEVWRYGVALQRESEATV